MTIDDVIRGNKKVCLSFSCGKDSIVAWLYLRSLGVEVFPVYLWYVPGLEFVEKSLAYYEEFFATKIARAPHPQFYHWLNDGVFQTKHNVEIIEAAGLWTFTFDEIIEWVMRDHNLPRLWISNGVRINDSLNRRAMFKKSGAVNEKRKMFYPIWDWNKERMVKTLVETGCRLPVDYKIIGSSFDGLKQRYVQPIKQHFPRDYAKIMEWFPLVDSDEFRRTI